MAYKLTSSCVGNGKLSSNCVWGRLSKKHPRAPHNGTSSETHVVHKVMKAKWKLQLLKKKLSGFLGL